MALHAEAGPLRRLWGRYASARVSACQPPAALATACTNGGVRQSLTFELSRGRKHGCVALFRDVPDDAVDSRIGRADERFVLALHCRAKSQASRRVGRAGVLRLEFQECRAVVEKRVESRGGRQKVVQGVP